MSSMQVDVKRLKLLGSTCTTEARYFGDEFKCKLRPAGGETIETVKAPVDALQGGGSRRLRRKNPKRKSKP